MKKGSIVYLLATVAVTAALLFSCKDKSQQRFDGVELLGAGATFPQVLYGAMFTEYFEVSGVKVNYQGIGSGGGIRQITEKTVDFAGSDAILKAEQETAAGAELIMIPTAIGAVVMTYNLPGNPTIKLTPELISGIYMGKIKKWNDDLLKAVNTGIELPDLEIHVVHRSDGSGTTYAFTDYLSKANQEWKDAVGMGTTINWPLGIGGQGNPGVQAIVSSTAGAIGYVELIYASQNNMPFADVKNASGNFITPSAESASACAQFEIADNTRVSIANSDSPNGYPISSFTWVIVYKEQNYGNRDERTVEALVNMLWWMIHDGQAINPTLGFAPVPQAAVIKAENLIKSVTFNGTPVL